MKLSVMTFNIRHGDAADGDDAWAARKSRTVPWLANWKPDVLALQEALDFQIADIRSALPGYESIGVGREDGFSAGEHCAIFFNAEKLTKEDSGTFWLSDTPETPGSSDWGNENVRICTWAHLRERESGQRFYLFNTHLDHESDRSRQKSVDLILERLTNRSPAILTGDFNVGEQDISILRIKSSGFQDTFRVANPVSRQTATFSGFGDLTGDKIDYVFVDGRFRVVSAQIIHEKIDGHWLSDHTPVTAIVELQK